MIKRLPVNKFEQLEQTSQSNEDFVKNYNEESDEGYFLEVDVQYPEKLYELYKEKKSYKVEKLPSRHATSRGLPLNVP